MKRLHALPIVCYALMIAAWIVDLLTPQLFVAAILLNGPIALSGLALSGRLTASLVIFAEVANLVAGYVNGVQAGYHWDSIAIGDRLLSAASFVLVGYLTTIAQEYAREAGRLQEQSRGVYRERRLRRALESVRETLNLEVVMRAIVREAAVLLDAREALLLRRASSLEEPEWYTSSSDLGAVQVERRPLDPSLSTVLSRIQPDSPVIVLDASDAAAALVLDARAAQSMLAVRLDNANEELYLFVFFGGPPPQEAQATFEAFAEGSEVAVAQAVLFMQLRARNDEIAAQRDEIDRRNSVIRDIVYALAHDLRTPLNAQNVTMRQALDGAYGALPDRYMEILRTTIAGNADVRRLVETLLLVARYESGESSRLREPVDVANEAQRVVDELQPVAAAKNVWLDFSGETGIMTAGDPGEVRRAIANLVANALEATPSDGTVSIKVSNQGDSAMVEVLDDGYGVPADQCDQLFQRFAPGDHRAGAGTGLGLYIVKLIADKMGGGASYEPRDGRGSIFRLKLPARAAVEQVAG